MPYGTGWTRIRDYTINKIDLIDGKMEKCPRCCGIGVEHGCIGEGLCPLCLGKEKVLISGRFDKRRKSYAKM